MASKGQLFVDTLNKVGYPNAKNLDGSDFDWMFEIPKFIPFLNWFCESVHEENVLTKTELQEYEKLKSTPDTILEGESLKKCLTYLSKYKDVPLEKKEINLLSKHLKLNEKQQNQLRKRRNLIQAYEIELNHKIENLEDQIHSIKNNLDHKQHKLIGFQKKLSNCLQSMILHSQELTNLFKELSENNFGNSEISCALFSHVDLRVYLNTEDQLLQQLRNYIKQYLNKPFTDLASGIISSINCELLDISNLLSNTSQRTHKDIAKNCREISRLHTILQKTEEKRIKELIAMTKAQEKVKYLENKIDKNYVKSLPANQMLLEQQQKQLETQIIKKRTEIEELLITILPIAIKKCIQCRSAVVLTGDYETKLSRQQFFYKRQKMVTDQLLKQRSRWEFLLLLFQVESHYQNEIHKLLTTLNDDLSEVWREFCLRKDWMNNQQIKEYSNTKELHPDDKLAKDLMMILESETQQSGRILFQTYDDLKETVEKVTQEHSVFHSFISSNYVKQMKQLDLLKECFSQMHNNVYNSNKENGCKSLMEHLDVANLKKLEINIHEVEKEAKSLIQDFEKKKKELKEDKHKSEERQLFIQFYTAPEKFQKTVNSLIDQAEGEEKLQISFAE